MKCGETMSKVSVDFSIENASQSQAFNSEGVFKDNVLIFHDEKNQKHRLHFEGKALYYTRGGDPSFEFTFENNVEHTGMYYVGNQTMAFTIQTHQFSHQNSSVTLTYTLKQGDIVVNHSELSLTYQSVQEA